MKITSESKVRDVLDMHKDIRKIFSKYNLKDCIGCKGAHAEPLAVAAEQHHIDVKALVKEINLLLEEQK